MSYAESRIYDTIDPYLFDAPDDDPVSDEIAELNDEIAELRTARDEADERIARLAVLWERLLPLIPLTDPRAVVLAAQIGAELEDVCVADYDAAVRALGVQS